MFWKLHTAVIRLSRAGIRVREKNSIKLWARSMLEQNKVMELRVSSLSPYPILSTILQLVI